MEIIELTRVFKYNSLDLEDPGPAMSAEQVRDFYANLYPEIVSAAIEGPEQRDDKLVYTFRRAVGTKGARNEAYIQRVAQTLILDEALKRLGISSDDRLLPPLFGEVMGLIEKDVPLDEVRAHLSVAFDSLLKP